MSGDTIHMIRAYAFLMCRTAELDWTQTLTVYWWGSFCSLAFLTRHRNWRFVGGPFRTELHAPASIDFHKILVWPPCATVLTGEMLSLNPAQTQALVYDILPPTTAITGYAVGFLKIVSKFVGQLKSYKAFLL